MIAPILAARGICNHFGAQQVHKDISFDVMAGEILGIAGGSGSGKSVLLRTLTGLRTPDAGEVLLQGMPVMELLPADKASMIGVLFQQGALFSALTVAQNIMLPLREYTTLNEADCAELAAMKLALAGLPADTGRKFPSELSGGTVKRAAFARALALDPRIMFLDEPTSGLDPISAAGIDELVLQLSQSLGITFVMISHDLTTLFTVCQRIAVLADKTIIIDTADKLMKSTQPWTKEFFHGPRADAAMSARKNAHGNR